MSPWLLPRIDDWAAVASLEQLNLAQSLRPWKARPCSRPHCPQPIPFLLTESASSSFHLHFSPGLAVLFAHSFVHDCNPPHSFIFPQTPTSIHPSILRPAITLSSRLLVTLNYSQLQPSFNPTIPQFVHIHQPQSISVQQPELFFIEPFCGITKKFYHHSEAS